MQKAPDHSRSEPSITTFVGASVTYIDGTLTNDGDKTVTHAVVRVTFKDLYNQVAQIEEVPIKVLQTTGPYPDTAGLAAAPLDPKQSKPFRLIFERYNRPALVISRGRDISFR